MDPQQTLLGRVRVDETDLAQSATSGATESHSAGHRCYLRHRHCRVVEVVLQADGETGLYIRYNN